MKNIAVLGSTGSIGTQTLAIVRNDPEIRVTALAASSNIEALEEQIREFRPGIVCVYQDIQAEKLRNRLKDAAFCPKIVSGDEGLCECASQEKVSLVLVAVMGMIGVRSVIAALDAGKNVALANKESLVAAGHLIMPLAERKGRQILPVDSEHSAIYQCLIGEENQSVERILLTASGGPFRNTPADELSRITLKDALMHPTWSMGKKITIDSSTMANKALEVIEAHFLFGIPVENIDVLIQPQSIIHSAVEFCDGSIKAQLGVPDMSLPISYALYYPQRRATAETKHLDFSLLRKLEFELPDETRFPALRLGINAGITGGSMRTVFCASDEEAVGAFLEGRIPFTAIAEAIRFAMNSHTVIKTPTLGQILAAEQDSRERVRSFIAAKWAKGQQE